MTDTTPRVLITTSELSSWPIDKPILFLGEWCTINIPQTKLTNSDAIIAEPFMHQNGNLNADIDYLQKTTYQLLTEITREFNKVHNVNYDERYWNIVLGHWLKRYTTVMFNRYYTIIKALNNYNIQFVQITNSDLRITVDNNSESFIWSASNNNNWNQVVYSKIIQFIAPPNIQKTQITPSVKLEERKVSFKMKKFQTRLKNLIVQKLFPLFCRKNDAFIIKSYLPVLEELKLQISLGQFPQFWKTPSLNIFDLNPEIRNEIKFEYYKFQDFEKFIRLEMPNYIPACYLEGYSNINEKIENLFWPVQPKFIFTSNSFDTEEYFKFWTAKRVHEGYPYFIGQHGNNYGTLYGNETYPEQVTCDKFLTWGWQNNNDKNIPLFNLKIANIHPPKRSLNKYLLLIELHPLHRLGPSDDIQNFKTYLNQQFEFTSYLPFAIRQKLKVRLHSASKFFQWDEERLWVEKFPEISIDSGNGDILNLIFKSKLVVHSYDSTGILETLALNIPTICFWQGGTSHLVSSAIPFYNLLSEVEILADSPEKASKIINKHWNNIEKWWNSFEVQKARLTFCQQYSRIDKHPIKTLKDILLSNSKS